MFMEYTPENIDKIIKFQIGYWKNELKMIPNTLVLGLDIVKILDMNGLLMKMEDRSGLRVRGCEDLRVYIDTQHTPAIGVSLTPFEMDYFEAKLPAEGSVEENGAGSNEE